VHGLKNVIGLAAGEKNIAINRLKAEGGGDHYTINSHFGEQSKKARDFLQVCSFKDRGIGAHLKAGPFCRLYASDGGVEDTTAAGDTVMGLGQSVEMKDKAQVWVGLKSAQGFLQEQPVGAEINEPLLANDATDNSLDVGME
jgi:hypothetical protein